MTDLRKAAQQALESLEQSRVFVTTREKIKHPEGTEWYDKAIATLRAALAQPDVPEGYVLVPVDALRRWQAAFAEELGAWDINPPLYHVQTSHDEIAAMLAAAPKGGA